MNRSESGAAATVFVTTVVVVCGVAMLVFGFWALLWPQSFADFIEFPPYNEHLLHDVGAFQIGIGTTLLVSLFWSDAVAVGLFGFSVSGWIHASHHALDLDLGGHASDQWLLGLLALLALVALILRLRTHPDQPPHPPLKERS